MPSKIIYGNKIAEEIKIQIKNEVLKLKENDINPSLAVIIVGNNPASEIYVRNKKRVAKETGIKSYSYELDEKTTEEELLNLIEQLNNDKEVNGILVQLPLPKHINENKVLLKIKPEKDVDSFHPYNVGLLQTGNAKLKPCTPAGIIELLEYSNVNIEGMNCVVIGRSNIVGKPMATMLLEKNATVTIVHSKTKNLSEITKQSDIIVVALGKAKFLTKDMIKEGAIIIDVGINRIDGKLFGDVDFDSCIEKAKLITPVPGGVGPMTIAMLMKNCLVACKTQQE